MSTMKSDTCSTNARRRFSLLVSRSISMRRSVMSRAVTSRRSTLSSITQRNDARFVPAEAPVGAGAANLLDERLARLGRLPQALKRPLPVAARNELPDLRVRRRPPLECPADAVGDGDGPFGVDDEDHVGRARHERSRKRLFPLSRCSVIRHSLSIPQTNPSRWAVPRSNELRPRDGHPRRRPRRRLRKWVTGRDHPAPSHEPASIAIASSSRRAVHPKWPE